MQELLRHASARVRIFEAVARWSRLRVGAAELNLFEPKQSGVKSAKFFGMFGSVPDETTLYRWAEIGKEYTTYVPRFNRQDYVTLTLWAVPSEGGRDVFPK